VSRFWGKSNTPNDQTRSLFDEATVVKVQNPAAPVYAEHKNKLKWYRRGLKVSIVAWPIVALLLLGAIGTKTTTGPELPTESQPQIYNAQIFLTHLLDSKGTPLPKGKIISLYSDTGIGGGMADVTFLAANTSQAVRITLEMQGAQVINGPSILPVEGPVGMSQNTNTSPWPLIKTLGNAPTSDAFTQALNNWAEAFTTGTPSSLALAVNDPNSSDHFTPLSGITAIAQQPNVSAYAPNKTGTSAIAEVAIGVTEPGIKSPVTLVYDILIENPSSSAPTIVAWGPPGSGPSLTPYQNGK